ncbi:hypothetical protein FACS189490_01370 [Clostridia bacterium]|nr:hypothetical protein FACS189490_01370 [Clostridia bacterium]
MNFEFEKIFKSDVCAAKTIVAELIAGLRSHREVSDDDETDLRLILSELLYNAVVHGNKNDTQKLVTVRVTLEHESEVLLKCEIADQGEGFSHKKFFAEYGNKDILESDHGRGVWLAASLTEDFAYNESGNSVTFSKRLSGKTAAGGANG